MANHYLTAPTVIDHERRIVGRGQGALIVYASPDAGPLVVLVWRASDGATFHAPLAACEIKGRSYHCAVVDGLGPGEYVVYSPDLVLQRAVRVVAERVTQVDWRRERLRSLE